MRLNTLWYCLKQGMINICRNIWFSLASVATISACIFLFCLFFSIIANVWNMAEMAETTVGITVFFDETLSEDEILSIGQEISGRKEVREVTYTSAQEAWEYFKQEYFGGMEELAEGFAEDNPLAGSASYEIFLTDISVEIQDEFVAYLQEIPGVRKVNYSNGAVAGLVSVNKMIGVLSAVIIGILLAVAIFLISNTISVAAAFRKSENQIMRLIGATNTMIRAPFLVEGLVMGLLGAAIPLGAMYVIYSRAVAYIMENYAIMTGIFTPMPLETLYPYMVGVALSLGAGIGFFGSFFTIRKHLKV